MKKNQPLLRILLISSILLMLNLTFVLSVPLISLISPSDNYFNNLSKANFNFSFKYNDSSNATMNCSLYLNDAVVGIIQSTINNSPTNITAFMLTQFSQSSYTWYVGCTQDSNSGFSYTTEAKRTFTYDNIAPVISNLLANTSYPFSRSDVLINFTVIASDTNLRNVTLNGTSIKLMTSIGSGKYSLISNTSSLGCSSEGICNLTAVATDAVNQSSTTSYTLTIDNSNPILNLLTPVNNSNSTSSNISFLFNTTDALDSFLTCSLYLNNVLNKTNSSVLNSTNTYLNSSVLADGSYIWNIICSDKASNTNTSVIRSFLVDTTPPIKPIISNISTINITTLTSVDIVGYVNESEVNVSVSVYGNGYKPVMGMLSSAVSNYLNNYSLQDTVNTGNQVCLVGLNYSYLTSTNFIEFVNYELPYFTRYNITGISSTSPPCYLINISPNLTGVIPSGTQVKVYDQKYHSGWFNLTISLFPNIKNFITVGATDKYGNQGPNKQFNITNTFNPGYSSLIAPILGVIPKVTTNHNISVIGYTNNSNSTLKVFSKGDNGNSFNENITQINSNVTVYGYSSIYNQSGNASIVWIQHDFNSTFIPGRFIYFSGHNRLNFFGYNITNSFNASDNSYTILYISPQLENTTVIGETVHVSNSLIPLGWFNVSLNLFSGQNEVSSFVTDSLGYISLNSISQYIYSYSTPPVINISEIINTTGYNITNLTFKVYDEYSLNFSTLMLNIINSSGNSSYYLYNSTSFNLTNLGNISCVGSSNNSNCSVLVNLTDGYYNLSFSVVNIVNTSFNTSILNYLVDTVNPTTPSNITLGAYSTSSDYLNLSWIASSANSGILYYEYAIGTSVGANNTYGWNKTNLTNIYIGPISLISNNLYYVSVRAVSNANRTSEINYTDILFFDGTGPIVYNVTQPLRFTNSPLSLDVTWNAVDNESSLSGFDIVVSKGVPYPWSDDSVIVFQQNYPDGSIRSKNINFTSSPLQYNVTYFTTIYGINSIGLRSSVPGTVDQEFGTTYDSNAPENISLSYPAGRIPNNNLTLTVNSGFDFVSGIKKYKIETAKNIYQNGLCVGIASWQSFYERNISLSDNPYLEISSNENVSLNLESGMCYQFRLIVENNAGLTNTVYNTLSGSAIDENVSVDSSPPSSFNVYDTLGSFNNSGLMTLTGDSLTITWDEPTDIDSSIINYNMWVTEQPYGFSEQQFSPYNISNPLMLTLANLSHSGLKLKYVLSNLSLNLSNQTDPTHQFKYRVYVKAVNGVGLSTQSNSDGIIYIDNLPPTLSLILVENQTTSSVPFFDYTKNNFTTVLIRGEQGMSCQWNTRDEGYKDLSNFTTNCNVVSNEATCLINETLINETNDGTYFYHISCKDKNGNINSALDNLDFNVTLDFTAPVINITSPTLSVYSSNQIDINFTVFDYSFKNAWILINSTNGTAVNQTILSSSNSSNLYYFGYVFNIPSQVYTNYTLIVYSNDSTNLLSNKLATFSYDNTTPTLNLIFNKTNYNDSFNFTLSPAYVRNVTWNVTKTSNSSVLVKNGTLILNYNSSSIKQLINSSNISEDGNYTLTVWYVNDINRSGSVNKTFILDRTAPLIHTPIFYMNNSNVVDFVLEINQTQNIFAHNFTLADISKIDKNLTINVDNFENFTLNFISNQSVIMNDFSNLTLSLLVPYYINNSVNMYDSKIVLRVYNLSSIMSNGYTSNSNMSYYDLIKNRLFVSDTLNINLSIEDSSNITSITYQMYDSDNILANRSILVMQNLSTIGNETTFKLIGDLKRLTLLDSQKNYTIKITSEDILGYQSVAYYNFTFIKTNQPTLLSSNLSGSVIKSIDTHSLFVNSNFSINTACNNSEKISIRLFNYSDSLLASYEKIGSGIININQDINYTMLNNEVYYLSILCKNELNNYASNYYLIAYDTSGPVTNIIKPVIESNSEYLLEQGDIKIFENLTITVDNITSSSALFKVDDEINQNSYQSLNLGQNISFFGLGTYHIRLLDTYYNSLNPQKSIVSFRLTKNENIESTYRENDKFIINNSKYYLNNTGNVNFYFILNDFIYENLTYNISLIRTNDSYVLLNNSDFVNSINYSYITPYTNVRGHFYNLTLNLNNVNLSSYEEYGIKIISNDVLNQSSIETFNFTMLNNNTYFNNPSSPPINPPNGGGSGNLGGGSSPSGNSPNGPSSNMGGGFSSSVSTCTDNIKNQNETNIDCGGTCGGYWYSNSCHLTPQASCFDGIRNQGETGVDCGGVCQACISQQQPKKIESCSDGIKNQNELGVDCAGVCSGYWYSNTCNLNPQTSCFDGIRNQGETGVDCGGVCQTSCENKVISSISKYKNNIIFSLGGVMLIVLTFGVAVSLRNRTSINNDTSDISSIPFDQKIQRPIEDLEKIEVKHEDNLLDMDEVTTYIVKEQTKGIHNSIIKNTLLNANWPEEFIEQVLEKTDSAKRLLALETYIKKARAYGLSEERIREILIGADWAEHFIDMVLHEVHVIHDDLDKVKLYANNMFSKGYSKEDILKTLLDAGWQKETVEPYIEEN